MEQQVSMETAARAAARMAAVQAMYLTLKEQAGLLIEEAREAQAHGLALKAGAIMRGTAGLTSLVGEGMDLAAQAVVKAAWAESAVVKEQIESPRLLVSDLPPEMQA